VFSGLWAVRAQVKLSQTLFDTFTPGSSILNPYHSSPALAIMGELAEHPWLPWKFSLSPRGWWKLLSLGFQRNDPISVCVARSYLEIELSPLLNVTSVGDWKGIDTIAFSNELYRVLQLGSVPAILTKVYPVEFPPQRGSHEERSAKMRVGTPDWNDVNTRQDFMRGVKQSLGGTMEALYHINRQHFIDAGGMKLAHIGKDLTIGRCWAFNEVQQLRGSNNNVGVSSPRLEAMEIYINFEK